MRFILAGLISISLFGQYVTPAGFNSGAVASATPALVSFRGMPSNESALANSGATTTCDASHFAYCTQTVDPTVSGQVLVLFYRYTAATGNTANVPTVSDNETNTWTACGTEGNNSANDTYIGCFRQLAPIVGTRAIKLTWTAAVSNVAVSVAVVYNIIGSGVYATNSGTAATTFTSGSATSTSVKNLWFEFTCGTSTITNVGAYSGGGSQAGLTGSWTVDLADRRDACALQHGVQTSAGAFNPSMTGASNNYVALGVSFKSGTSGSAPTGMYVSHIYSVSSATGTGNLSYQVPVTGNLVAAIALGGSQFVSAVSDTVNGTWKSCGTVNNLNNQASSSTFYAANISPGLLTVTATTSGTGDVGPMAFYDITGAATTQICARAAPQAWTTATAGSQTITTNYTPSSSAGIVIGGMSEFYNTSIGVTSPTYGEFDSNTVSIQSRDGPSVPDQNNLLFHGSNSSNTAANITVSFTSSTFNIGPNTVDIIGFQAPAATLYPVEVNRGAVSSSSSVGATNALTLSYTPFKASDVLAALACTTATSGTITITDGVNGTWTNPVAAVNNNGVRCGLFYISGASGSAITISANFSAATSFRTLLVEEAANCTTLDKSNIAATTASGNVLTGTSTGTLSNANEIALGFAICNSCDLVTTEIPVGVSTVPWTQLNYDSGGNTSGHLAVASTTAIAVNFIDVGNASGTDVTSIITFH